MNIRRLEELLSSLILVCSPLLALAAIIIPFQIGVPRLAGAALFLSVPLFITPFLYTMLNSRDREIQFTTVSDLRPFFIIFILLILAVVIAIRTGSRSLWTILALAIAGCVIFAEILFMPRGQNENNRWKVAAVLGQLAILQLCILWSVTLVTPLYYGGTDVISHLRYVATIIETGFLEPDRTYTGYPLFHILAYVIQEIFGPWAENYVGGFILTGLVYSTLPIMIFSFSQRVVSSERIALLAAFTTIFYPTVLQYGLYSIPRSITPVFVLLLFIVFILNLDQSRQISILLVLLVALVLIHPSSFPFIFVICCAVLITDWIFVDGQDRIQKRYASKDWISIIGMFTVITISYWSVIEGSILEHLTTIILRSFGGTIVQGAADVDTGTEVFDYSIVLQHAHWSFFIFASLTGVLFTLKSKSIPGRAKSIIFLGFGLLIVSIPGPLNALGVLDFFNLHRFGLYTFIFVAITCGVGAYFTIGKLQTAGKLSSLGVVFIALILLLSSGVAATGHLHFVSDNKKHLTENELVVYAFADEHAAGDVHTDYVTGRYFDRVFMHDDHYVAQVHPHEISFQGSGNDAILIIRHSTIEIDGVNFHVSSNDEFDYRRGGTTFTRFHSDSELWNSLNNTCTIYSSNDVKIYHCI